MNAERSSERRVHLLYLVDCIVQVGGAGGGVLVCGCSQEWCGGWGAGVWMQPGRG